MTTDVLQGTLRRELLGPARTSRAVARLDTTLDPNPNHTPLCYPAIPLTPVACLLIPTPIPSPTSSPSLPPLQPTPTPEPTPTHSPALHLTHPYLQPSPMPKDCTSKHPYPYPIPSRITP